MNVVCVTVDKIEMNAFGLRVFADVLKNFLSDVIGQKWLAVFG